ncbi:MAG: hypothetical protein Q8M71_10915 [Thermodesulfovibrionales bacterium]|nr:hypothetical protein [Thermodesulfovibrionales bacterium]
MIKRPQTKNNRKVIIQSLGLVQKIRQLMLAGYGEISPLTENS